jgi:hypothetical protein
VRQSLEVLISEAYDRVAALRAAGDLSLHEHPHVRNRVTGFRYGEEGFAFDRAQEEYSIKEVWWGEPLESATQRLAETQAAALQALPSDLRSQSGAWLAVTRLFEEVAARALEEKPFTPAEVRERIELLDRSLRRAPVKVSIRADLIGVAVLTDPIELEVDGRHIVLRAVQQDDIEEEFPLDWLLLASLRLRNRTSAILRIEYEAVDASGWQPEMERAIAVLRLFGIGDVRYTLFDYSSESMADPNGGMLFRDYGDPRPRTYAIRETDRERLRQFWTAMARALPEHLYWRTAEDPQDLAATHLWYREALAGRGWVNAQAADVVRALESLFMRSKDRAINATLARRVSMLFGACGLDAAEVRETMSFAYRVRSAYVHGDYLPPKLEADIERRAGGVVNVFRRCLDYVRLSLVAAITAGVDKEGLITALDEAEQGNRKRLEEVTAAFHQAAPQ